MLRTLGVGSFGRVKLARAALSHALWDASGKPPRPGSDLGDPGSGNGMCRVLFTCAQRPVDRAMCFHSAAGEQKRCRFPAQG